KQLARGPPARLVLGTPAAPARRHARAAGRGAGDDGGGARHRHLLKRSGGMGISRVRCGGATSMNASTTNPTIRTMARTIRSTERTLVPPWNWLRRPNIAPAWSEGTIRAP